MPQEYVEKKVEIIAFTAEVVEETNSLATHFASEAVLAKDWLTPAEDAAWKNL